MAKEIERKFLIKDNSYVELATKTVHIRQAYLSDRKEATVRLRVAGRHAFITVKSRNHGASRDEWEYEIPLSDAEQMASTLCGGWAIDKVRHFVPMGGLTWEVDVFHGRHEGLVIAEVELPAEDTEIVLPDFVGVEVTGDPQYYNSVLASV